MTAPRQADPVLIGMLESALVAARQGRITEFFLMVRAPDYDMAYDYCVDDLDDLLFELGTVILKERGSRT